MLDKLINFINKNSNMYFNFIKQIDGFPSVCDYSSMILGAYLNKIFNTGSTYISGDFNINNEDEGEIHNWLNIDGIIIDFTLSQFYPNIDKEFIIMENSYFYNKYEDLEEYEIPKKYITIANNSSSFEDYLIKIKKANIESMFN